MNSDDRCIFNPSVSLHFHPIFRDIVDINYSVGAQVLFNPGGSFDKAFHTNATGALEYNKEFYPTHGAFQAGYLDTYFKNNGLIGVWGYPLGPQFKSFPFYEDAKKIRDTIKVL